MVNSRADLIGLLRALILVAPIPCLVGIWLWYQSEVGDYRAVMTSFYGAEAAKSATQSFAQFDIGGIVRRIPSTFTNAQAFFVYCLMAACGALALHSVETSRKWKVYAIAVFILAFITSFFSGMRVAFVLSPLSVIAFFILPGQGYKVLTGLIGVPLLIGSFFFISDFELEGLVSGVIEHAGRYEESEYTLGQILYSLESSPFGNGTGTNTLAARYVVDLLAIDNNSLGFFEVYLAKACHELGFLGFLLLAAILFGVLAMALVGGLRIADRGLRSAHAALGGAILALVAHCFKAPTLDLDPGNVLFWVFIGIMSKLKYLAVVPSPQARYQGPRYPVRAVWNREGL